MDNCFKNPLEAAEKFKEEEYSEEFAEYYDKKRPYYSFGQEAVFLSLVIEEKVDGIVYFSDNEAHQVYCRVAELWFAPEDRGLWEVSLDDKEVILDRLRGAESRFSRRYNFWEKHLGFSKKETEKLLDKLSKYCF